MRIVICVHRHFASIDEFIVTHAVARDCTYLLLTAMIKLCGGARSTHASETLIRSNRIISETLTLACILLCRLSRFTL